MPEKALVRTLDDKPAIVTSFETRSYDDPSLPDQVTVRVGDDYRTLTAEEWDALPPWNGPLPRVGWKTR